MQSERREIESLCAQTFGAFLLYQLIAILYFGRTLVFNLASMRPAQGPDAQISIWCMEWWPYAIAHRISPFITKLIFAPDGFNLAWGTSLPLQSLIAAPITRRWGPVAAMNVLDLMTPALAALGAFILIRHLVRRPWPALFGGYLFGFSPFIIGHSAAGHLLFLGAFLIPLAVYLFLMFVEQKIGALAFAALLTLMLCTQFLFSMELFATMVVFGAIALAIAWMQWPPVRPRLWFAIRLAAVAMSAAVVIVSPVLYYALIGGHFGVKPVWPPLGADLLELIVPRDALLVGLLPHFTAIAAHYLHFARDTGAYVGLPMLVVLVLYFKPRWGRAEARYLAAMLAVVYVAMLGTHLRVAGAEVLAMPWRLVAWMPLLNSALPVRFAVYLHLALAIVAASWLAQSDWSRIARGAMAAAVVVSILPNPHAAYWATGLGTPALFTDGGYRDHLKRGETVMTLPYGASGQSMTWQALSGMYFASAGGYLGPLSPGFRAWPIVDAVLSGVEIPDMTAQLSAFLAAHGVTAVVIDLANRDAPMWLAMVAAQGAEVERVDGVAIARPTAASLAPYRGATALEMECRLDNARFERLVAAGQQYLKRGLPLSDLSPLNAQRNGLLPQGWVRREKGSLAWSGMWLGPWPGGRVSVGVEASYACAAPLAARYARYADATWYPYRHHLRLRKLTPNDLIGRQLLVMVFRCDKLDQAASLEADARP